MCFPFPLVCPATKVVKNRNTKARKQLVVVNKIVNQATLD